MLFFLGIVFVLLTIGLLNVQIDSKSTFLAALYISGMILLDMAILAMAVLVWAVEHGKL